ncbi:MAG TPA: biotin--[acetyl-CoA-carboxylase] ligase [Candidatus Cloacimonadota bacterium]|nr:biotin--[acetyl-CoA-carboxylase] ligase [Candidatus Cloacimonadota bacterium]HPS37990.1 biotin--[acetyl-CoA-carboxylase] ligase [Candidatus Cloacimonadota bacterium]
MQRNQLFYKTLDSTFMELERLHSMTPRSSFVIRASSQTSGIGRKQNFWASPEGGLWYSFDLRYSGAVESFALYVGVCVHKVLIELFQSHMQATRIKWPNDIYFSNRKLAGILTRYYHSRNLYLIGLGMNVNNQIIKDRDLSAISLQEILGEEISLNWLSNAIMDKVTSSTDDLKDPRSYLSYCEENLYGLGRRCCVEQGETRIEGRIKGLGRSGNLVLEDEQELSYGSLSILE